MKIVTILGSPRKRGNTAAVLQAFEALVSIEHQVERINITDYHVAGCRGCDHCFGELTEPGCLQKDDAVRLLARILAADVVVYACPVYCWSFPAQLKALLDRHYCLVKWQDGEVAAALMTGKRVALLVTCGGEADDNADLIQVMFDREIAYVRGVVVGKYVVANCTTPAELGERAAATARRMVREIIGGWAGLCSEITPTPPCKSRHICNHVTM
ncbi:MAG: NAD(P)H-dependent oxidoreductase [Chloroflexi bacterium]|nr:NAD(P)H-dependent oxidoreductase [Chloroflexota bacterium]